MIRQLPSILTFVRSIPGSRPGKYLIFIWASDARPGSFLFFLTFLSTCSRTYRTTVLEPYLPFDLTREPTVRRCSSFTLPSQNFPTHRPKTVLVRHHTRLFRKSLDSQGIFIFLSSYLLSRASRHINAKKQRLMSRWGS